ncbi:hypothetical protein BDP27DRAFT_1407578 [Rhodocollybia butyracea]|uniref:Hydrophobin n=1 Tax=Rhodocollybia butyracea TaxID=206335 RepID=A0A9P5PB34_9AGAR|nr:hypothetical protein BDP27DRAFT_1407578 [Rhodocollybia butyracea]
MRFTLAAFVTAALVTLTVAVPQLPPLPIPVPPLPLPLPIPRSEPGLYTCTGGVAPVCCTNSIVLPGGGIAGEGCAVYKPFGVCASPSQIFCCENLAFGFGGPCVAATLEE